MSNLKYFDYEGFGDNMKAAFNYSQAVRIENRIEISGQGGWDRLTSEFPDSLTAEIDAAFDNVDYTLKQAGGTGLDQVYKLRIYHTGELNEYVGDLVRNMKERFKEHGPLLTVVRVAGLYSVMKIEIEAEAYLG